MFVVGPTFFSNPGDHPPGDGLTRLQCLFAGASPADTSSFAIGSGVQDGGTMVSGYYDCVMDAVATFPRTQIWTSAQLLVPALSAMTFEAFFDLIELIPQPNSNNTILSFGGGDYASTLSQNGYVASGPSAPYSLAFDVGVTGSPSVYSGTAPAWGTNNHFAMVFRTTGYYDVCLNGTRVYTGSYSAPFAPTGSVQLGGNSTAFAARREYKFYGARVRAAEMYFGASFTPPSGPAAWGPP